MASTIHLFVLNSAMAIKYTDVHSCLSLLTQGTFCSEKAISFILTTSILCTLYIPYLIVIKINNLVYNVLSSKFW